MTGQTEFTNDPTELVIRKVNPKGKPLPGAEFQLKNESGQLYRFCLENGIYIASSSGDLDKLTSDANGLIRVRYLPQGNVQVIETKAPAGYVASGKKIAAITDRNGTKSPCTIDVLNNPVPPKKVPPVPKTGERTPILPFALIALAAAALAIGIKRKAKQQ